MPAVLLYVRTVDKVNPDSKLLNNQLAKRGDVICIVPPEHQFSELELKSEQHAIIKADLTEEEQFALLAREPLRKPEMTKEQCRRRINFLNLDLLQFESGAEITKGEFDAAFAVKPKPDLAELVDQPKPDGGK